MDPLEWLARLADRIPDPGKHRTLAYLQRPAAMTLFLTGQEGSCALDGLRGDAYRLLQRVLDAGFSALFGVLGHVDDADVNMILEGNLKGRGCADALHRELPAGGGPP